MLFQLTYAQELYQRVKIYLKPNAKILKDLSIEPIIYEKDGFITEITSNEVQKLKKYQVPHEILVYDLEQFYQQQIYSNYQERTLGVGCKESPNYQDPTNFRLGSMGGFYTYQEALAELDSMRAKYPQWISPKTPISPLQTHQNRPIYFVRISDNPDTDENEPEMLYTALHHSREPASLMQLIYYMWYLLENTQNPEIAYLLQNTELYFVPIVNPDGYVYNQTTNPAGGGMWRKNRRPMQNNTFGVDLNRNYGYFWGYNNTGSSPDSTTDTYRGPSPFSEPETQNIRDFCIQHQFKIAINYHTYGNLLIYPWGYEPQLKTPDSTTYLNFAKYLTQFNNYTYGTGDETVNYVTNGDSDDWMYGEQTLKNKILAMTPEVGNQIDGFWPAQTRILPLCRENLFPNLSAAKFLLKFAIAENQSPKFVSSLNYHYRYLFKRLGFQDGGNYTVQILPLSSNIQSTGNPNTYIQPAFNFEKLDSIAIQLNPNIQPGELIQYAVIITNGSFIFTDTLQQYFYGGTIIFASDCNSLTGWTTSTWGVQNGSLTESPNGNYPNNSIRALTSSYFDASNAEWLLIQFKARWDIEKNYDYLAVQISDSGSNVWQNLCGMYTKSGSSYQIQNEPLYDGYQPNWITENMIVPTSIFNTNPNKVRLRFRFQSDSGVTGDGFHLDDVEVRKINNPVTSFDVLQQKNKPTLSPNPFLESLHYQNIPVGSELSIFNAQGQKVWVYAIKETNGNLLLNLPVGLYYYQISYHNQIVHSGKLVKAD